VVRIRRKTFPRPDGAASVLAGLIVGVVVFLLAMEALPVGGSVPPEPLAAAPVYEIYALPDFTTINDIDGLKRQFFEFLRPIVEAENARVMKQRERLLALQAEYQLDQQLAVPDLMWLRQLAREYELPWFAVYREKDWDELCLRVDIIPTPLALTQAALESGWGTSRLVRASRGLFGEYGYTRGCGIVPENRAAGDVREYRVFETVNESVRSYVQNLNTLPVYRLLWILRNQQREAGEELDSYILAAGLRYYSERGDDYVAHVRQILRMNRTYLETLPPLS
jgi:Bax protein